VDEGIRLGVTVIPAFFMYGRLIVGSSFRALIRYNIHAIIFLNAKGLPSAAIQRRPAASSAMRPAVGPAGRSRG
jgi:hypothetical protein